MSSDSSRTEVKPRKLSLDEIQIRRPGLKLAETSIKFAVESATDVFASLDKLIADFNLELLADGRYDPMSGPEQLSPAQREKLRAFAEQLEGVTNTIHMASIAFAKTTDSLQEKVTNTFADYYEDQSEQTGGTRFDPHASNSDVIISAYGNFGNAVERNRAFDLATNAIGEDSHITTRFITDTLNHAIELMSKSQTLQPEVATLKLRLANYADEPETNMMFIIASVINIKTALDQLQIKMQDAIKNIQEDRLPQCDKDELQLTLLELDKLGSSFTPPADTAERNLDSAPAFFTTGKAAQRGQMQSRVALLTEKATELQGRLVKAAS